ncbi:hypothetical protein PRK78_001902 [Emydomyces testavorans]|uniref:CENP-V/GFA domain-containing protein n=1 Tax=Emydomyces testavorans TaxID=2070801 RepID=A0AAF0IH42_9EURO|nr:hypothetical protein PRK78_001902 [Emydomyces testavorans]
MSVHQPVVRDWAWVLFSGQSVAENAVIIKDSSIESPFISSNIILLLRHAAEYHYYFLHDFLSDVTVKIQGKGEKGIGRNSPHREEKQSSMEGRCQCSQIRFTTPLPAPLKVYICHCTECRHQSSSAYGLTAIFPSFEIPVLQADNDASGESTSAGIGSYTRITLSGRKLECLFCKSCGSRLMHRAPGEETLSVKAGCLIGLNKEHMKDAVHIWCREAIVDIPLGAERFEEEPVGGSLQ